jgi:hypothetical protein
MAQQNTEHGKENIIEHRQKSVNINILHIIYI